MTLNLCRLAYPVTSLGPRYRAVLWVAGCDKYCPGCISPEMQNPASGRPVSADRIIRHLLQVQHPLNGLTVSGGEPLDQADALCELFRMVRQYFPEWNIMVYTGYELDELRCRLAQKHLIWELMDILVDGRYQKDIPSDHPLTGSGNQKIHCLSDRGRQLQHEIDSGIRLVNFGLGIQDHHMIIGIPQPEKWEKLRKWISGRIAKPGSVTGREFLEETNEKICQAMRRMQENQSGTL